MDHPGMREARYQELMATGRFSADEAKFLAEFESIKANRLITLDMTALAHRALTPPFPHGFPFVEAP